MARKVQNKMWTEKGSIRTNKGKGGGTIKGEQ